MNESLFPDTEHLDPVTLRRHVVLSIVVQEYTQTAQPVASNTIARDYELGVSAATIRNDLAALEKEGLLTHPHTSAGRIPTEAGYRYFVRHLLSERELPTAERSLIRTEFREARREMDQWLRVSTAVLARASHSAALATPPRAVRSRYKHMELVAIQDTRVLMVLVLEDGTVKQRLLDLDEPMAQHELSQISNELNSTLAGSTAAQITKQCTERTVYGAQALFTIQISMLVAETLEGLDQQLGSQIYRHGLSEVLDAPEFAENSNVRKIVRVFEQRSLLEEIIGEFLVEGDVQVVIPGNGRFDDLQNISLVLGSYGVSDRATGVLGVVGPLRMSYGRTISAVRFVASLMSEMVYDLYGAADTQSRPAP